MNRVVPVEQMKTCTTRGHSWGDPATGVNPTEQVLINKQRRWSDTLDSED